MLKAMYELLEAREVFTASFSVKPVSMKGLGGKNNYWIQDENLVNHEATEEIVNVLGFVLEELLRAHPGWKGKVHSLTMMVHRPGQWDQPVIEWHVDQKWVGDGFVIGCISGSPYIVEWAPTAQWAETGAKVAEIQEVSPPAQYEVHGPRRWHWAHRVVHNVKKKGKETYWKYRVGLGDPSSDSKDWRVPSKSRGKDEEKMKLQGMKTTWEIAKQQKGPTDLQLANKYFQEQHRKKALEIITKLRSHAKRLLKELISIGEALQDLSLLTSRSGCTSMHAHHGEKV